MSMDKTRFVAIVEAYGADPRRWPAAEHDAAAAFVAAHPEAAGAVLQEAAALDRELNAWTTLAPSDIVRARIVREARRTPLALRGPRLAPVAAAMAASLVVGIVAGFSGAESAWRADLAEAAVATLEGPVSEDSWMGTDG